MVIHKTLECEFMQTCAVCTHEYDIDINALMRRYLDKSGIDYIAIDTGEVNSQ